MSKSIKWIYTVVTQDDGEDFIAFAPDLPEVLSRGLWDSVARAGIKEALSAAVLHRIAHGMELAPPSYTSGDTEARRIALPPEIAKKANYYLALKNSEITEEAYVRMMSIVENKK